jgi:hypothetical protein
MMEESESFKKEVKSRWKSSFAAPRYATALLALRRFRPPLGLHQHDIYGMSKMLTLIGGVGSSPI